MRRGGQARAPATAALGAALVLVGLTLGLSSAMVPGVGLLALAAGAVGWVELASRGARLERDPGPRQIVEGDPYPLRIRLRGSRVPLPGGELADSLLERPLRIGPLWNRRLEADLVLEGPGRRSLEPARLTVRDPLGLWERELVGPSQRDLVLLPRVEPVVFAADGGGHGGARPGGGVAGQAGSRGAAEIEVDGLRPYRPGAPASRIHWPTLARTGELVERRLSGGGASDRPLVVVDARGQGRDAALRAAASLCVALARAGGCTLLLPGQRRLLEVGPDLRAWPDTHARIALTTTQLAPAQAAVRSHGGTVVWVSAGHPAPRALRGSGDALYLVTPGAFGGRAAFTVAGCEGVDLHGGGSQARSAATSGRAAAGIG